MKFFYNKQSGIVKMRTEKGNIGYDKSKIAVLEYTPTEEELAAINAHWDIRVEDGKLIFEKPAHIEVQEKLDKQKELIQKAKDATTVKALKEVIAELIPNLREA